MNYTQNHHLPQWEKDDRIMMEDFNDAMARLENGLNKTARDAAEASADAYAAAGQAAADAAKAQATADNAYCPGKLPYVIGSYQGTGGECPVNLGFMPSFLVITAGGDSSCRIMATPGTAPETHLSITSTGFIVRVYMSALNPDAPDEMPPYLSASGRTYSYIAFR